MKKIMIKNKEELKENYKKIMDIMEDIQNMVINNNIFNENLKVVIKLENNTYYIENNNKILKINYTKNNLNRKNNEVTLNDEKIYNTYIKKEKEDNIIKQKKIIIYNEKYSKEYNKHLSKENFLNIIKKIITDLDNIYKEEERIKIEESYNQMLFL